MPNFFTVAQTAKSLNVSKLTVYRRTISGEIPSTRVGRRVLIPTSYLQELEDKSRMSKQPTEAQ